MLKRVSITWVLIIAIFIGAILFAVAPKPAKFDRTMAPNAGDGVFVTWTMERELRTLPAIGNLFDAKIFAGYKDTIAWSENLLAITPVYGVFWLLTGHNSIAAYNLTVIVLYMFLCFACFVLINAMVRDKWSAAVGTFLFAFSTFSTGAISHPQMYGFGFFALALFLIARVIRTPGIRDGILLGLCTAAIAMSMTYYFVLFVVSAPIYAIIVWWANGRKTRAAVKPIGVGILCAGIILLPIVLAYLHVRHDISTERADSSIVGIHVSAILDPPKSLFYSELKEGTGGDVNRLFPGLIASLLALGGVTAIATRKSKDTDAVLFVSLAVIAVVAFAISIGPNRDAVSIPYRALRLVVPGLAQLRELTRFWVLPMLLIAALGAAGFKWLKESIKSEVVWKIVVVCVLVLVAVEMVPRPPFGTINANAQSRAVNRKLAKLPNGITSEAPTSAFPFFPYMQSARQLRAIDDDKRRFEGYSGLDWPKFVQYQRLISRLPQSSAIIYLQKNGVRYLVLHGGKGCYGEYTTEQLDQVVDALKKLGLTDITRVGNDAIVKLPSKQIETPNFEEPAKIRPIKRACHGF